MKKIIFICLIALGSTLTINAQTGAWTYGTRTIKTAVDTVKIGSQSLSDYCIAKLIINKSGAIPSSNGYVNGHLVLNSAGFCNSFGVDTITQYAWIQSRDVDNATHPLTLNQRGGNVGVGLYAPASVFHSAGQISTGIPNGGLGGASATTGSILFYNSYNTNTVSIYSSTTTASYSMKLPIAQGGASEVLTNDGSGNLSWSNPNTAITSTAWLLTGNSGTAAPNNTYSLTVNNNFIGTTDNKDFAVATNNLERMRVKSGGYVGIGTSTPSSKLHVNDGYIYISDPAIAHGMTSIVPTDVIGFLGKNNGSGGLQVAGLNESNSGNGLALVGNIGVSSTSEPAVRIAGAVKSGTTFSVVPNTHLLFTITNSNVSTKLSVLGNGNMGLGTTSPSYKLTVNTSTSNYGVVHTDGTTIVGTYIDANGGYIGTQSNHKLSLFTNNGGARLTVTTAGDVGIGITNPGSKLDVNGTSNFSGNMAITGNVTVTGSGTYSGTWTMSDQMFKTNVDSIQNALATIKLLKPKMYYFDTLNYKEFNFTPNRSYGFLAQDLSQVLPELVSTNVKTAVLDTLGNIIHPAITYKAINYTEIIAFLTKGMQEQSYEVDSLKTKVIRLDSVNASLQKAQQESMDSLRIKTNNQESINASLQNQLNQLMATINNCCSISAQSENNTQAKSLSEVTTTQIDVKLNDVQSVVLEQNVPNPFAEQTTINYFLTDNTVKAQILFYDAQGKLIQSVDLIQKGKGTLNVFASDLSSGIYTYTLVVDGKIVETKKMMKQ